MPAAIDGPLLVKLTVPLTVLDATAVAGTETVVVTSASGEIAVVADAESGAALAPWLVVVPMVEATVTEPLGGAVKVMPTVIVDPAPKLVDMPAKVTAPVAGS